MRLGDALLIGGCGLLVVVWLAAQALGLD